MKRKSLILVAITIALLAGCRKADRISHNISREADEMNVTRKVTVINGIQGDVLFQMTGNMSIEYSDETKQLTIIAEDDNGSYKKHIVGISDNVSYIVEDVTGMKGIDTKYRIYFNPDMVIPTEIKIAD